jgi:hypothetical protein
MQPTPKQQLGKHVSAEMNTSTTKKSGVFNVVRAKELS